MPYVVTNCLESQRNGGSLFTNSPDPQGLSLVRITVNLGHKNTAAMKGQGDPESTEKQITATTKLLTILLFRHQIDIPFPLLCLLPSLPPECPPIPPALSSLSDYTGI